MARAAFLHTADLHLSRPFGFLPPQLAEERRRDQRRAFTRIVDLALERDVDIVLIAGDLFDCPNPDPTDVEVVTKEFARLTEQGKRVIAIPGNHDYISPGGFWQCVHPDNVHVFRGTDWETLFLDDLGMAVTGTAFQRNKSERRAFDGLDVPADISNIVLVHASYEAFEGQLERYHPFSSADMPSGKVSYAALGHYHRFNTILGDGVVACYPGTPEGISFEPSETDERYVILGEIGDDGHVKLEPVRINRRTMRSAEIDCTLFETQTNLFDTVRKMCEANSLVELRLVGTPTSDIAGLLEGLPNRFKESCFYLTVDASDLFIPGDLPADERTIRGRFCRHLLQQIENATDAERRRLYRRALELGLAAFEEG